MTAAETLSIQQQIDKATAGETIEITAGEHDESIIIDKPIRLVGNEGATLVQQGSDPIITIQTDDAVIENLDLAYANDGSEAAAIFINGDRNELKNINIQTNSYGVHLDDRKSTRLNSSHVSISYAVFCLKK